MYLLDTNILIYHLKDNKEVFSFVEAPGVYLSLISFIEVFSQRDISQVENQKIQGFMNTFDIIDVHRGIGAKAIEFRKHGLKIPDAIIAATAWWLQVPLVSVDRSFRKLKQIKVINPFL